MRVNHLGSNPCAKRLCELARITVYLHSKIENRPIAWGLVALTEKDFLEQARLILRSAILAKDQATLRPTCFNRSGSRANGQTKIARIRVG
jgi:hypothetical protein